MEVEELRALLAENNRALEAIVRRNLEILTQAGVGKAAGALTRLARGIWLEVVIDFVALLAIGSFAADHAREVRFFVPAVALGAYAVAIIAGAVAQLVAIHDITYDEPVVAIARRLEQLKLRRIRSTLRILLFAPLMWVPLFVVALQAFFGVDVYAAGWEWLCANLLFGLAVIPLAVAISRRYGSKLARIAPLRGLTDDIAGRSLVAAQDHLDAIRRFEEAV